MLTATLYRKYRPQTFSEVVNQRHICQTLINAIRTQRVAHAYLFSGPRGTGKTSLARIFAKALNCKSLKENFDPCNECDFCKQINEGKSLDLVEIDAASHRGIDEIRNIKEEIRFGPRHLKYKVIILDESHMLTKDASNALLKSLEEPPPQTIFILVTTEIQKIIPTIYSRCLRLIFSKLSLGDIIGKLKDIAQKEGFEIDEKSVKAIAIASNGSIRDSESLLGKIFSLGKKKIDFALLQEYLGFSDEGALIKLADILGKKDLKSALDFIQKLSETGTDFKEFTKNFIHYFRKIALIKTDKNLASIFAAELTKEELAVIIKQAEYFKLTEILKIIDQLLEAYENCYRYPIDQMALEVAVIKILNNE